MRRREVVPTRATLTELRREVGVAIPAGTALWGDPGRLEQDLVTVVELGATWVRTDFAWTQLSWAEGQIDYTPLDAFVDAARRHSLDILGVLGTLPAWLRSPDSSWRTGASSPRQMQGFAEFAAATAARYLGRVSAWEVWNEPNVRQSWGPIPSSQDYGRLLRLTVPAIRQVAPSSIIIAGGTGGAVASGVDIEPRTWLRALLSGALSDVDALAVHPYSDLVRGAAGEMGVAKDILGDIRSSARPGLSLWATEVGAPTGGENSVTPGDAGRLVRESLTAWRAMGPPGPFFYYTLRDSPGTDRESKFGLLDVGGAPKPAAVELQQTIRGGSAQ